MIPPQLRNKDYAGAALMIVMGIAVAFVGSGYRMGALTNMGAGYIPVVLGVLMVFVGVLIGVTASRELRPTFAAKLGHEPTGIDVRAWGFILGGVAAFVVFGVYGGLVPATFASVFISALGDRKNTIRDAALLALGLVVAGYLISIGG